MGYVSNHSLEHRRQDRTQHHDDRARSCNVQVHEDRSEQTNLWRRMLRQRDKKCSASGPYPLSSPKVKATMLTFAASALPHGRHAASRKGLATCCELSTWARCLKRRWAVTSLSQQLSACLFIPSLSVKLRNADSAGLEHRQTKTNEDRLNDPDSASAVPF